jgi:hypothetical protein
MSDKMYPSGPWTGFYNYQPKDKHRMDLHLSFTNGNVTGEGNDDVGAFVIKGKYCAASAECHWTKTYLSGHDVFYRGFREGKGIWGTWEIRAENKGGFHIWPKEATDGDSIGTTALAKRPAPPLKVNAPLRRGLTKTASPLSRRRRGSTGRS